MTLFDRAYNAERAKAAARRQAAESEAYQRSRKILEEELAKDRAWRDAVKQVRTSCIYTGIQIVAFLFNFLTHSVARTLACFNHDAFTAMSQSHEDMSTKCEAFHIGCTIHVLSC